MKYFSSNLKLLRRREGLTQSELATMTGTGTTTISNYEKGVSEPNIDMLMQLSKVLGVTLDRLVGEDLHEVNLAAEDLPSYGKQTADPAKGFVDYLKRLEQRLNDLENKLK